MASNPIKTSGKGDIKKVGHTAGSRYGTNEAAKVKGSNNSRDLTIR